MNQRGFSVILIALGILALVLVIGVIYYVAGFSKESSSIRDHSLTAFEAIRLALPLIKRDMPSGQVIRVMSHHHASDGSVDQWQVDAWLPTTRTETNYLVALGGDLRRGFTTEAPPEIWPVIATVERGVEEGILDSDQAIAAVGRLGVDDFVARTGAGLQVIRLAGPVGGDLRWTVGFSKPYTEHQVLLVIDARTGTLLEQHGEKIQLQQ